jgi:FMN phosphatase YigB (HAD superfamily)
MPKYGLSTVFEQVCDSRKIARHEAIMIGDSLGSDIWPAQRAGLQTLHIGTTISDVTQLINHL